MRLVTIVFERLPIVWFLLGLLFFSAGLYLGFDYSMTFVYLTLGAFCCGYGLVLFLFLMRERPKKSTDRTLSPNFISVGSTVAMPSPTEAGRQPEKE